MSPVYVPGSYHHPRILSAVPKRRITPTLWDQHRQTIEALYCPEDGSKRMTLEELSAHFREEYGFGPTDKQWKNQLYSKWNLKKKLNLRSAAAVLSFLRWAEESGTPGRVFYHRREKTRQDIATYIRKIKNGGPEKIYTEDDLQRHTPDDSDWPAAVVFVPHGQCLPWETHNSDGAYRTATPASHERSAPLTQMGQENMHEWCLPQLEGSMNDMQLLSWATSLSTDEQGPGQRHSMAYTAGNASECWAIIDDPVNPTPVPEWPCPATLSDAIEETERASLDNSGQALYDSLSGHAYSSASINVIGSLASTNPVEPPFSYPEDQAACVQELAAAIKLAFGPEEAQGVSLTWKTVRKSIEACIWANFIELPLFKEQYERTVTTATCEFGQIEAHQPDDVLPTINEMRFYFELYGQRPVAKTIFQHIRAAVPAPSSHNGRVICEILDFWVDLLDWDKGKLSAWRSRLRKAHAQVLETKDRVSKPSLAILFIEAWVALDLYDTEEGYNILNTERHNCEQVFGLDDYQTIAWMKHLARGCLYKNNGQSAEAIITEVIQPRVKRCFGMQHPLFWATKYQLGLYKVKMADKNTYPIRRNELWTQGTELMKQALVWQARELGIDNLATATTLKWCKEFLRKQGKHDEANGLRTWCIKEVQETIKSRQC